MKTPEEIKTIESALIDIETTCGHCPYEGEPNGCCNRPGGTCKMFDVAMDAAEALEQLRAQQPRWISVGERLPENGALVVALCRYDFAPNRYYLLHERYDLRSNFWHDGSAQYWMPLPELPEVEIADN